MFADQLLELVTIWFVWDLTQSSAVTGIATFAGRAPFWMFGFVGATLVDRFGPLELLRWANLLAALIAFASAANLFLVGENVGTFLLLAFALNTVRSVEAAALTCAVPVLMPGGMLRRANSVLDAAKRIGRLLAPLATRWFGVLAPGYFLVAVGTAYAFMIVAAQSATRGAAATSPQAKRSIGLGRAIGAARRDAHLRCVFYASAAYAFFHGMAFLVVLPRLVFEVEGANAFSFGLLLMFLGIGGIAANIVLSRVPVAADTVMIAAGMAGAGICFFLLVFVSGTSLSYALAALAGASLPLQDVFVISAIQARGPKDLIARLHALWRLFCECTLSVGVLLGGVAVDHGGATAIGLICGVAITGCSLFLLFGVNDNARAGVAG